jgi:hypothetical protein
MFAMGYFSSLVEGGLPAIFLQICTYNNMNYLPFRSAFKVEMLVKICKDINHLFMSKFQHNFQLGSTTVHSQDLL